MKETQDFGVGVRASSGSFYSHLQAEIAHTSKDTVTIVTRGEPEEMLPPGGHFREQQP